MITSSHNTISVSGGNLYGIHAHKIYRKGHKSFGCQETEAGEGVKRKVFQG